MDYRVIGWLTNPLEATQSKLPVCFLFLNLNGNWCQQHKRMLQPARIRKSPESCPFAGGQRLWGTSGARSPEAFPLRIKHMCLVSKYSPPAHNFCIPLLEAQMVKYLPAMWETQVGSLGWEDPLEKGLATHSSILAWRIPWTEEPGGHSPWGCK